MKQKKIEQHQSPNKTWRTGSRQSVGFWLSVLLTITLVMPTSIMAYEGWEDRHEVISESRGHMSIAPAERYNAGGTLPQRMERTLSKQYVLKFNDSWLKGDGQQPAILFLKKELHRQYPGIDVTSLRLQKLVLVAKTKYGRGTAELRVGSELTDPKTVAGRPKDFASQKRYTFDKVRIANPCQQSWGPWQLNMKGIFNIREVVLIVDDGHSNRYSWGRHHSPYIDRPLWKDYQSSIHFRRQ